jgi:hypothetical protein
MSDDVPKFADLSSLEQWYCLLVGLILAAMVVGSAYGLFRLIPSGGSGTAPTVSQVFVWACMGGFLGGAARGLFTFKHEISGYGKRSPSDYLKLWFTYFFKPFIGVAGGLFFFLVVNLGLVGLFSDSGPEFGFLRVSLTAVIGGMFFENVFALLETFITRRSSQGAA